jgi:hypothetical protein
MSLHLVRNVWASEYFAAEKNVTLPPKFAKLVDIGSRHYLEALRNRAPSLSTGFFANFGRPARINQRPIGSSPIGCFVFRGRIMSMLAHNLIFAAITFNGYASLGIRRAARKYVRDFNLNNTFSYPRPQNRLDRLRLRGE